MDPRWERASGALLLPDLPGPRPPGARVSDATFDRRAPERSLGLRAGFGGMGILSAAMLASGGLAYVFHILAARTLDAADYGRVAILWAALYLLVVMLFRPLEQTASRTMADRLARGEEVRSVVRSIVAIYLALVVLGLALVVPLWGTITERLFAGDGAFTVALVAGLYGYGLEYMLRGVYSGAQMFRSYGLTLMVDAVARLLVAAPLLVVASSGSAAAAVAVAGIAGALVPGYLDRRRLRALLARGRGGPFRYGAAAAFAGPAAVIAAADQLLVNGGPLLVVLGGGPGAMETAGVVFAATMLVRIPVYVFQGPAASLLPNLTRLHAHADAGLFRRTIGRAAGALLGICVLIVLLAATIGPAAMSMLFGAGFDATRLELTLLGIGVSFYLVAATISQALLAAGDVWRAAVGWTLSAVAFVALYVLLDGSPLQRTATALSVATAIGAVAVGIALIRRLRRA